MLVFWGEYPYKPSFSTVTGIWPHPMYSLSFLGGVTGGVIRSPRRGNPRFPSKIFQKLRIPYWLDKNLGFPFGDFIIPKIHQGSKNSMEKLNGTESQWIPVKRKLRDRAFFDTQVFVGVRSVGPVRDFLESWCYFSVILQRSWDGKHLRGDLFLADAAACPVAVRLFSP